MTCPSLAAWASSRAKMDVTAAATIPRGARAARKTCSLKVVLLEKRLAPNMVRGRTTRIRSASRIIPWIRVSVVSVSVFTLPERTRKSREMMRTRRCSLNSRMCFTETDFWFARAMPMTVTVRSPDSWTMALDAENAMAMTEIMKTEWRKSGM